MKLFMIRPATQPANYGWLFSVRYDFDGVAWLNGVFPIQLTDPRGLKGTARRFIDGAWQMVDEWSEVQPDVFGTASGDESRTIHRRLTNAGGPFLWVHGENADERVWWQHGQERMQGERQIDPVGFDGPDWDHLYFVSHARGTGDVIVWACYNMDFFEIFPGKPYPNYGYPFAGIPSEMGYIDLWRTDLDIGESRYQEPSYVTWDPGTSSLYVCGRRRTVSSNGWQAVIGRVVPSGLPPVGSDTPDDATYDTTFREYIGPFMGFQENGDPVLYSATSVRVLLNGRMVATFAGQYGTEPELRYKTEAATWEPFDAQPPHEGWEEHKVTFIDAHGVSLDDLWVVGIKWHVERERYEPLCCHWDGLTWTDHDVSFGKTWLVNDWLEGHFRFASGEATLARREDDGLRGVTARSTDDVWIVGHSSSIVTPDDFVNFYDKAQPFTAHWDGEEWTHHLVR